MELYMYIRMIVKMTKIDSLLCVRILPFSNKLKGGTSNQLKGISMT